MWLWLFISSALLNLFLFLYIRWLLQSLSSIGEEVQSVYNMVSDFAAHTKTVHELEMFYGDETLKKLMIHANEISQKLEEIDLLTNEDEDVEAETEETT